MGARPVPDFFINPNRIVDGIPITPITPITTTLKTTLKAITPVAATPKTVSDKFTVYSIK